MRYFYLSFCDVTLPKGTQFLGATVVGAESPEEAVPRATELGLNPGGEVAVMEVGPPENATEEGKKYYGKFVPREVVMQEIGDSDGPPDLAVCQSCNPRVPQ